MRHRILIVDDDQSTLNLFSTVLKDRYTVETARSGEDALRQFRTDTSYAVVLSDIFLPGMRGTELLGRFARLSPDTVRIALTGSPGRDPVVDSVNQGNVFRFVAKPVRIETLTDVVDLAVQRHDNLRIERDMMETTVRTSVNLLLEVLATIDPCSFGLSQRIRGSVGLFGRLMNLPNVWELELAAALARIGTVSLPEFVVRKVTRESPLSATESAWYAQVPQLGCKLLKQVPRMERVAQAILYQAKNYDGAGLPIDDVARNSIPLGARVLRVFRDRAVLEQHGMPADEVRRVMVARQGFYDPSLLDASFQHFPDSILAAATPNDTLRFVSAEQLQPGWIIMAEVRTTDGLLLMAAGTRLTPLMLQRIETHVALGTLRGPFEAQPANADPGVVVPLTDAAPE